VLIPQPQYNRMTTLLINNLYKNRDSVVANAHIDQLLPEIADRLIGQFTPEQIFLFGSHVWGTPHADSDLDLLVIVTHSNLTSSKRSAIAYRTLRDIPYPLDILVKTRQEIDKFARVPMSLEHEILSKGKCIYG
jgi:predicted nucleotidyltransferase